MQSYKEIMRRLVNDFYEPEDEIPPHQATTSAMLNWFRGVIPHDPIDEHDVFDVLSECGFRQTQKIITERVCIVEEDKKKGIVAEYDEVEVGRILVWNLYEK